MIPKVEDLDNKLDSFQQFVRLEHAKIFDRLDKLDQAIQNLRKLIGQIAEQLKSGKAAQNL